MDYNRIRSMHYNRKRQGKQRGLQPYMKIMYGNICPHVVWDLILLLCPFGPVFWYTHLTHRVTHLSSLTRLVRLRLFEAHRPVNKARSSHYRGLWEFPRKFGVLSVRDTR